MKAYYTIVFLNVHEVIIILHTCAYTPKFIDTINLAIIPHAHENFYTEGTALSFWDTVDFT